MQKIAALVLFAALAIAFAACGDGEGTAETTAATTPAEPAATPPATRRRDDSSSSKQDAASTKLEGRGQGAAGAAPGVPGDTSASFSPPAHEDSGGGAAELESKGGDNSIQQFGAEASGSELAAAAAAMHGYLDARAAAAWRDACSYMANGVAASLSQLAGAEGEKAECPTVLASLSAGVPPASLREAAVADVAALRQEGERAFLLFRGARDAGYFMPMAHEAGGWKVAALAPSALP